MPSRTSEPLSDSDFGTYKFELNKFDECCKQIEEMLKALPSDKTAALAREIDKYREATDLVQHGDELTQANFKELNVAYVIADDFMEKVKELKRKQEDVNGH